MKFHHCFPPAPWKKSFRRACPRWSWWSLGIRQNLARHHGWYSTPSDINAHFRLLLNEPSSTQILVLDTGPSRRRQRPSKPREASALLERPLYVTCQVHRLPFPRNRELRLALLSLDRYGSKQIYGGCEGFLAEFPALPNLPEKFLCAFCPQIFSHKDDENMFLVWFSKKKKAFM